MEHSSWRACPRASAPGRGAPQLRRAPRRPELGDAVRRGPERPDRRRRRSGDGRGLPRRVRAPLRQPLPRIPVQGVSYRVQLVQPAERFEYAPLPVPAGAAAPVPRARRTLRHLAAAPVEAASYEREALPPGACVRARRSSARRCARRSSARPGGEVGRFGEIVIEQREQARERSGRRRDAPARPRRRGVRARYGCDRFTATVLANRFRYVVEHMCERLLTARSRRSCATSTTSPRRSPGRRSSATRRRR